MINKQFTDKINKWKEMPRNNPDELCRADNYFDTVLMPLSKEVFISNHSVEKQYYGMMLTLGTSWQPLALSISALKPEKVLVMCTNDTIDLLRRLKEFTGLDNNNLKVVLVDRSESQDIYLAMRQAFHEWNAYGEICVDITGGTKAMSSSAAMMGAVLGLDIYYVESKYLPLYRRPEPGSEYLKCLANPS